MDFNDKTGKIPFAEDDFYKKESAKALQAQKELRDFLEKAKALKNPNISMDEQEELMRELHKSKAARETFLSDPKNKEWYNKLTQTQQENAEKALQEAQKPQIKAPQIEKPEIIPSQRQRSPGFPEEHVRDINLKKFQEWQAREPELLKRIEGTKLEPRYIAESPVKPSMTAADEMALSRLSKGLSVAGGLAGGALVAKDVAEGNPLEAGITGLETGLGYLGSTAGRAGLFLELLRPTLAASEEHELAEIAKYKRQQAAEQQELADLNKWGSVNDILSKSKKGRNLATE